MQLRRQVLHQADRIAELTQKPLRETERSETQTHMAAAASSMLEPFQAHKASNESQLPGELSPCLGDLTQKLAEQAELSEELTRQLAEQSQHAESRITQLLEACAQSEQLAQQLSLCSDQLTRQLSLAERAIKQLTTGVEGVKEGRTCLTVVCLRMRVTLIFCCLLPVCRHASAVGDDW